MARVNRRIDIPIRKPLAFMQLTNRIVSQHKELGDKSPLTVLEQLDMVAYTQKAEQAAKLRAEAEYHRQKSESLMEEAQNLIGVGPSQNINTEGTLYNVTRVIKDFLAVLYKSNPEKLEMWGFNVVTRKSKMPTKKQKPVE